MTTDPLGTGPGKAARGPGEISRRHLGPIRFSNLELALDLAARAVARGGVLASVERQVIELGERFGEPMIGSCRIVFDTGEDVIKVAYTDKGVAANASEANWDDDSIPLASCEFVLLHPEDYLEVLRMEKVRRWRGDPHTLPAWAWNIDGPQVGYDRLGRLVAYDL